MLQGQGKSSNHIQSSHDSLWHEQPGCSRNPGFDIYPEESTVTWMAFPQELKKRDDILQSYGNEAERAMECLEDGFEDALTVLLLPIGMRQSFRTSNHIERINRELKRLSGSKTWRLHDVLSILHTNMDLTCNYRVKINKNGGCQWRPPLSICSLYISRFWHCCCRLSKNRSRAGVKMRLRRKLA